MARAKNPPHPEWTDTEIIMVRRMGRQNASPEAIRQALGTPLSADAIRTRAKRYGITLSTRTMSKLQIGAEA